MAHLPIKAVSCFANTIPHGEEDDVAFCTHECLLHLLHGEPQSSNRCPNQAAHGYQQAESNRVVQLLAEQLKAVKPGRNGLAPLRKSGRSGVLYRVRLFKTGHCLVAKGYQHSDYEWLQNEIAVYDRLRSLQSEVLPVYCGVLRLSDTMISANGRTIQHLLLLSWAGHALGDDRQDRHQYQMMATRLKPQLLSGLKAIHETQVIHGDPERRNMVLDEDSGRLMMVDFERSRMYSGRLPCDPTKTCQKRYRDKKSRQRPCSYCRELRVAEDDLFLGSSSPTPEPTVKNISPARTKFACRKSLGQAEGHARINAITKIDSHREGGRERSGWSHRMTTRSYRNRYTNSKDSNEFDEKI
jgi:hypothetical protein